MKAIRNLMPLCVIAVLFAGCSGNNESTVVTPGAGRATTADSSKTRGISDPAEYKFHRDVAFTEVTKTMPDGSVDHIDLNMAADPNVVVVVTVSATPKDGLRFVTTFTGPNDLSIVKEWGPVSGAGP